MILDDRVVDRVREVLGGDVVLVAQPRAALAQADVWRCDRAGRPVAWLKRHDARAGAARERLGLAWSAMAGGSELRLLDLDEADLTFLIAHVDGVPLADLAPGPFRTRALAALGAWLGALHALPYDDLDAVPPARALELRRDAWLSRAAAALDPAVLARVRRRLDGPWPDPGPRVPCHRDLRPSNVLVRPDASVVVIDFGQARADVAAVDLLRLATSDRVVVAEASGERHDPALVGRLVLLGALGDVAWAHAHAPGGLADREARVMLERGEEFL